MHRQDGRAAPLKTLDLETLQLRKGSDIRDVLLMESKSSY